MAMGASAMAGACAPAGVRMRVGPARGRGSTSAMGLRRRAAAASSTVTPQPISMGLRARAASAGGPAFFAAAPSAANKGVAGARPPVALQAAAGAAPGGAMEAFVKFSNVFSNLFPLWTALSAGVALTRPETFSFLDTNSFTALLATLMLSMGITLTVEDFKRVFGKPIPVALNMASCYVLMPILGLMCGKLFGLSDALTAGCVVVGSINGGQASNLCTYIAKGDVALSVLMTTSTTIGCIFLTPLICKLMLGAVVPVDAMGIAISTIQVVLLPIIAGVTANSTVPKVCRAIEPACPVIGVVATVLLVGSAVAQCAGPIIEAGLGLQFPLIALHLLGGLAGYFLCKAFGQNEVISRTTAIETSMKSSAFGFLLASLHFGEYMVRVPSAVSVVWMAIIGSTMAVIWRRIPIPEGK